MKLQLTSEGGVLVFNNVLFYLIVFVSERTVCVVWWQCLTEWVTWCWRQSWYLIAIQLYIINASINAYLSLYYRAPPPVPSPWSHVIRSMVCSLSPTSIYSEDHAGDIVRSVLDESDGNEKSGRLMRLVVGMYCKMHGVLPYATVVNKDAADGTNGDFKWVSPTITDLPVPPSLQFPLLTSRGLQSNEVAR